jgi:hypothetical protein
VPLFLGFFIEIPSVPPVNRTILAVRSTDPTPCGSRSVLCIALEDSICVLSSAHLITNALSAVPSTSSLALALVFGRRSQSESGP